MATKQEILTAALAGREEEILMYQINIDNYTVAIAAMEANPDPELAEYKTRLENLLRSERLEQKKVMVIRDAIQVQLTV